MKYRAFQQRRMVILDNAQHCERLYQSRMFSSETKSCFAGGKIERANL
jgi:hypothetical protein